jgi:hypothetical protein
MGLQPSTQQIDHNGEPLSDVLTDMQAGTALTSGAITTALGFSPVNPAAAVLSGTPEAPTASTGTSSTQIATTAFVQAAVASSTTGVASVNGRTGAVSLNSGDVTGALGFTPASTASPALTGTPTAPTAANGNSSTQLATTAFVQAAVVASTTGVSSVNGRTGAVTLGVDDVVNALEAGANAAPVSIDSTTPNNASHTIVLNRLANKPGGTNGHVRSALFVDTTVAAGVTNFEWGITSRVNNSASTGENVGVYGQGNKLSTGGTWGGCFEVCDTAVNPTTNSSGGTIGAEVDVWCNGADDFEQRIGIDVVAGNAARMRSDPPVAGPKGYAYDGVRIGAFGNINTEAAFHYGVKIMSAEQAGIVNIATGVRGIYHLGSYTVGIDLSQSNNSDSALRIKANDWICLDANSQYKLRYDSATGRLQFYGNGANRGYINLSAGADADLASGGGGGSYVDLTSNQTIGGTKNFSNALMLPSATVGLGATLGSYGNMSSWGGTNARSFTDSVTLNIDSLCTDGVIRTFMSATPTNVQVESALRPLYCIVSTLVKALQERKVI